MSDPRATLSRVGGRTRNAEKPQGDADAQHPPWCSLRRKYRRAVALDANAFEKLHSLVSDLMGDTEADIEYTAKLADKSEVRFKSLASLTSFENPRPRSIRQLRVTAYDRPQRFSISFSTDTFLDKPVEIDIEGPDKEVTVFMARFEAWLEGVEKGWAYSVIARHDSVMFTLFTFACLWFGMLVAAALKSVIHGDWSLQTAAHRTELSPLGQLFGLAVMFGGPVAVGFGLNLLRKTWFPSCSFLIGLGARRYEGLVKSSNTWFFGIIPLVLSVIGLIVGLSTC